MGACRSRARNLHVAARVATSRHPDRSCTSRRDTETPAARPASRPSSPSSAPSSVLLPLTPAAQERHPSHRGLSLLWVRLLPSVSLVADLPEVHRRVRLVDRL